MRVTTITNYLNNLYAHQQAGWHNGKIRYKGLSYTYAEFNNKFPLNAEKVVPTKSLEKYKGDNPDGTKVV